MRATRRRRLRSYRWIAVTLVTVIGLGAAGTAVADLGLKPRADALQANLVAHLEAGQRELLAGKDALTQANSKHDLALVTQATAHFAAARTDFQATSQLADGSRLLRYLEFTPALGEIARTRHTAVDGIAQMGVAISDAGHDLSAIDAQLMNSPSEGRTVLKTLDQVHSSLAPVRVDLQRAQTAAAQVNLQALPAAQQGTFTRARDSIASGLAGLDEIDRLMPVLTDVLGGNGIRRYLVEQVNPAELRAGGGFIGTYSLLQADQGSLKVLRSGDAYDLANPRPLPGQPGFIPLPGPYHEIIPDVSWSFVDSNESPDFPTNAQTAETFVEPRIGTIDGVISIDYYAVAKMLELTGPLQVPGYGAPFDSSSFVSRIMGLDIAGEPHKEILSALAAPLMARITSLAPDQWPALITALTALFENRDAQVYLNSASAENEVDRLGWSGRVNPGTLGDFMMEVESNYGSGKVNYFVRRDYAVVLSRTGSVLHHKVTIDYYANANDPGLFFTYKPTIRLYVDPDATVISNNLIALTDAYPSSTLDARLLAGWLPAGTCCGTGGHAEVVLEYDTPWRVNAGGEYLIYWQKQPGTLDDAVALTWEAGSGPAYKVQRALAQDLVIALTGEGVTVTPGDRSQTLLPSLNLGLG